MHVTLRSVSGLHLTVPPPAEHFTSRAFLDAGPTSWKSLPDRLRDPAPSSDNLKKLILSYNNMPRTAKMLHDSALYKSTINIDTGTIQQHASTHQLHKHQQSAH